MKFIKKLFESLADRAMLLLAWFYGVLVFRIFNAVKIIGRYNIPTGDNILFVANHQTLADSFLIGPSVTKFWEMFFQPKKIPWNSPDKSNFFGNRFLNFIFKHLKNIPVTRGKQAGQVLFEWLRTAGECLKKGRMLIFFEGTRTRTGEIGDCKSGVAELIYQNKPTVIPIYLDNIQAIMPLEENIKDDFKNFIRFRWFRRGSIIIGAPIEFDDAYKLEHSKARKIIAQTVKASIIKLQKTSYEK